MSGTVSDNTSQSSGSVTAAAGGISIVSSDPTLAEGLVWYNSTSNVLKVARTITGWSTVNPLLTANQAHGGAGTASAGLSFGGYSGGYITECEEWDGTSWTEVADLTTARGWLGGTTLGTTTATLAFAGSDSPGEFL